MEYVTCYFILVNFVIIVRTIMFVKKNLKFCFENVKCFDVDQGLNLMFISKHDIIRNIRLNLKWDTSKGCLD